MPPPQKSSIKVRGRAGVMGRHYRQETSGSIRKENRTPASGSPRRTDVRLWTRPASHDSLPEPIWSRGLNDTESLSFPPGVRPPGSPTHAQPDSGQPCRTDGLQHAEHLAGRRRGRTTGHLPTYCRLPRPGGLRTSTAARRAPRPEAEAAPGTGWISRRQVAEECGLSATTVAEVENGAACNVATIETIGLTLGAGLTLVTAGERAGFYRLAGMSSGWNAWATPQPVLDSLCEVLGGKFDLDPCASRQTRLRKHARRYLTEDDDGLSQPGMAGSTSTRPMALRCLSGQPRPWTRSRPVEPSSS